MDGVLGSGPGLAISNLGILPNVADIGGLKYA